MMLSGKEDLNLDVTQTRETENNLAKSSTTVESRLKETCRWLLVPFIDQYADMKNIQWERGDLGGGADGIVVKAARKMQQAEQMITKWAPALLRMSLDELLWKDSDDISVKKLWEYLCAYCYLPRLSGYGVLENAIAQGAPSTEHFAIAAAYADGRYVDLKYGKAISFDNPSDLLVKPEVVRRQIEAEMQSRDAAGAGQPGGVGMPSGGWANAGDSASAGGAMPGGWTSAGDGGAMPGAGASATPDGNLGGIAPVNRHFYMSAKLDNTRVNRDVNNYVQEVIQHLMNVDGAQVEINLEVDVIAQGGIQSATVRTVSENCRTLMVSEFGFDD